MDRKYQMVWTENGLTIEGGEALGQIYIPWEQVESLGAAIIREAGAYDQAMGSRGALNRRYNGND
mgnify:CR=1 FL=1